MNLHDLTCRDAGKRESTSTAMNAFRITPHLRLATPDDFEAHEDWAEVWLEIETDLDVTTQQLLDVPTPIDDGLGRAFLVVGIELTRKLALDIVSVEWRQFGQRESKSTLGQHILRTPDILSSLRSWLEDQLLVQRWINSEMERIERERHEHNADERYEAARDAALTGSGVA